jgi:1,2-diacylglycerol 3-alpha-glucosyltransferase
MARFSCKERVVHILMITDVYFPRVNGVSTSIRTFIRELEKQGHRVTLIAPRYGENDDPVKAIEGAIIRVPSRVVPLDPEDRFMNRQRINQLMPELDRQCIDIVHIQTPFVAHYAGVALARTLGVPVVETYHTYFEEYLYQYLDFLPRSLMRWLARWFSRVQSRDMNAMVAPSTLMKQVLNAYGIDVPMQVIPTGLDHSRFSGGSGGRFRAMYGIAPERPVLCHVGRMAHEKNIDFLLDMLVEVKRSMPDILLVLAGEGPALKHLKNKASGLELDANVLFVGYLDRDRALKDCYRAGDAFVFASRTETQGLVLLEAMALGVPVVSTAVLGTVDIIAPGRGALVARDDIADFTRHVVRLLTDTKLRLSKGVEAVAYAHEWSASEMASRMADYYQRIIDATIETDVALQQVSDSV